MIRRTISMLGLLAFLLAGGFMFFTDTPANAASLAERLSGRILLQVESAGEAWYIDPVEEQRYYLGRPRDAFDIMRTHGLGITTADLEKIPENTESSTVGDRALRDRLAGRILLQVEAAGEAWYVHPETKVRYFLGRPKDAFEIMRTLGLGITNSDLLLVPRSPSSLLPGPEEPAMRDMVNQPLGDGNDEAREALLTKVNQYRLSEGRVGAVRLSADLSRAAQHQADDMTAKQYFSLISPEGKRMRDWLAGVGYGPYLSAVRVDSFNDEAAVMIDRWRQQSPNEFSSVVLNDEYRDLGVGFGIVHGLPVHVVYLGATEEDYFAQGTQDLGDMSQLRTELLVAVNAERANIGVEPLVLNDELNLAAQAHTDDMLARGFYDHLTPEGKTPGQRIEAAGYEYRAIAENIAKGQFSVSEVMEDWMNSPGHREHILDPIYAEVGFGLSFGSNVNGHEILWAQNFGTPL